MLSAGAKGKRPIFALVIVAQTKFHSEYSGLSSVSISFITSKVNKVSKEGRLATIIETTFISYVIPTRSVY